MSARKGIVLDANILIRAALGIRVCTMLEAYEEEVEFFTPDVCSWALHFPMGFWDLQCKMLCLLRA